MSTQIDWSTADRRIDWSKIKSVRFKTNRIPFYRLTPLGEERTGEGVQINKAFYPAFLPTPIGATIENAFPLSLEAQDTDEYWIHPHSLFTPLPAEG